MDGWTLLYKTVERDLETKSDVLIAIVHWQLLRVGMKCIGIGDDKTLSQSDEESELLPDGWNINKTSYALRYKYENEAFILMGMVVDDSIVLNLLNGKSLEVANAAFVLEPTVASLKGPLNNLIPGIEPIIDRLRKELVEPVLCANKKKIGTQTTQTVQPSIPLRNPQLPFYDPYSDRPQRSNDLLRDLRDIGRNDLNPLGGGFGFGGGGLGGIGGGRGGGGGGMLFSPPGLRNPQNIGPGGLPGTVPGARFDPFNPLEVERQRRNSRDFDHFRPPVAPGSGFYDDMFM